MRRLHFGLLGAAVPVLALSLALVGCGGGDNSGGDVKKDTSNDKKTQPAKAELKPIEPGKGVIRGTVSLKGGPPNYTKMNEALMAEINKNQNKAFCFKDASPAELEQQHYRIKDGKVQNVFVWIEPVDKKAYYFKIDEPKKYAETVEIDQPHCAFIPHVAVVFPEYHDPKNPKEMIPTGQKIFAKNTATEAHNTKYKDASGKNPGGNEQLKPGASLDFHLVSTNEPIVVNCDIHGWMNAYLRAFDHPYAATTKEDGTYEIKDVPTGVKVRIIAWHESAGDLNGKSGQEIEVKEGTPLTQDFNLEVKEQ